MYLRRSKYIDFDHPSVAEVAQRLTNGALNEIIAAKRCFEFVRDEILHSRDHQSGAPTTSKASDVLRHKTGYCYAKSHLLAALLRANGIPAGLCYQRLSIGDMGPPYCLHGLNAVYLRDYGWYRIDARGNKPGVSAEFDPPKEILPYSVRDANERDLPEIWEEPLPLIINVLETFPDTDGVYQNLPDVALLEF